MAFMLYNFETATTVFWKLFSQEGYGFHVFAQIMEL